MLEFELKQECAVVYFTEDIDISNAFKMKDHIIDMIDKNNLNKVIFNFRKVKFIDSSGISIFIKVKSFYENKVEIRLCEVLDTIKKSFEYSHLSEYLGICDTEEDAIESLIAQK